MVIGSRRRLRDSVLDEDESPSTQEHTQSVNDRRLFAAFDALPQSIVVTDRDGEIVYRNRQAVALLDAHDHRSLVTTALLDLIAAASAGAVTERRLDFHGPPRVSYLVRSEPLFDGTELIGVIAVSEDVTERARLDAIRRDFVANISHELKTPVGALGLLAETLSGEDDPVTARRLLDRVHEEVERVAATIDDLLELSRIEFDDDSSNARLAVSALVASAVERVAVAAEARGLRLHVVPHEEVWVRGDRRQLLSALNNLLDNAVKYSYPDGEIVVSVELADSATQNAASAGAAAPRPSSVGKSVRISVADSGAGIPARDLDRIFERFYRVDRARSRDTGGTGLGLAIVRHVMFNHHGTATVRSREGRGSTFTLTLPLPTEGES
jgi:two-component system sensor histidine kinase SenX3